jgi:hypothetical protein
MRPSSNSREVTEPAEGGWGRARLPTLRASLNGLDVRPAPPRRWSRLPGSTAPAKRFIDGFEDLFLFYPRSRCGHRPYCEPNSARNGGWPAENRDLGNTSGAIPTKKVVPLFPVDLELASAKDRVVPDNARWREYLPFRQSLHSAARKHRLHDRVWLSLEDLIVPITFGGKGETPERRMIKHPAKSELGRGFQRVPTRVDAFPCGLV